MQKRICSEKLNGYLVNRKAVEVINKYFADLKAQEVINRYDEEHPYQKLQPEQGIALRKVAMNGVEFLAYVKSAGKLKAIVNLERGKATLVSEIDFTATKAPAMEQLATAIVPKEVEENIHLRKVVVRSAARKRSKKLNLGETVPTNSEPFYAFIKQAGSVKCIVNIKTGEARIFANEDVISSSKVSDGRFTIDGIIYGKKDTLNGFARYEPIREAKKSLRKKLSINGPIVTAAMRVLRRL